MRPGCSTMKRRFGSSRGAVTYTGFARPEATSCEAIDVPLTVGMPAQIADVFSSWHVDEQPSPLVVLPSSHSSVPSIVASPQTAAGAAQLGGAGAAAATTRPDSFRRKLVNSAQ